MKAIDLAELPKLLKLNLDCEMNKEEKYLDVSLISNWTAESEDEYEKFECLISEYKFKGNGFTINTWCDISGYNYWVMQQNEPNYIQLTVNFDNDNLLISEIDNLVNAINEAECFFSKNVQSYY